MSGPADPVGAEVVGWQVPGPPASEGRWGQAGWVEHPEWWTSTDADSTEVEVSDLVWGLVRALQPRVCVETGSGWGQTTAAIGRALAANGHGWLHTFEVEDRRVAHTSALVDGLPVTVHQVSSLEWGSTVDVEAGTVDFVWLDSLCHYRVPEFLMLRPWMSPTAVACFHDTRPGHCYWGIESKRDLRSEIDAVLGDQLVVMHLPTPRGVTVAQVKP